MEKISAPDFIHNNGRKSWHTFQTPKNNMIDRPFDKPDIEGMTERRAEEPMRYYWIKSKNKRNKQKNL